MALGRPRRATGVVAVEVRPRRRQPSRRPSGAEDLDGAREGRWLLAIPDAISQVDQLDRQLLTRRDIERLCGVLKARGGDARCRPSGRSSPATNGPGPGSCSSSRSTGAGPRSASRRRDAARLVAELQAGPADRGAVQGTRRDHEHEAGGPARRSVGRARPDRGTVRRAEDALVRLYTLAQALGNDLGRFQALVGR